MGKLIRIASGEYRIEGSKDYLSKTSRGWALYEVDNGFNSITFNSFKEAKQAIDNN